MAEILRSKEVPPALSLCPPYPASNDQGSASDGYVKNMASIPRIHSAVSPETPTLKPAQLLSLLPHEQQKYIQRAAISVQSTSSNKLVHPNDGVGALVTADPTDLGRITSTIKPRLVEALLPPRTSGSDRGVAKPAKWNKRALELEETPELAAGSQVEAKRRRTSKGIKSDEEKGLIVYYMQEEMNEGNVTEKKWANIARKLRDHGLDRSQWSVKAWWSRHGRLETGMDERQKPNERRLVTSKQDPEDRRKAREVKKRESCQEKGLESRNTRKTSRL
ncbi:MAG: hypothetical protein LQ341_000920 [Variospora aurantia]|nr:MAG: hypothetical protein LQ341_000920 [Variospora aurantia]